MKKFFLGCIGFSLLCFAFSCGQQAFKQPANAAAVGVGGEWVHAEAYDSLNHRLTGMKALLNLQHVSVIYATFPGKTPVSNIAVVQTMYTPTGGGEPALYQIDAADVPK